MYILRIAATISHRSESSRLTLSATELQRRTPNPVIVGLSIVLILTSSLLVLLILLHRGKGGGLSSLFGGSVSSSLSGSSVVEKNLDRLTLFCGAVWTICIIGLGLLLKAGG
jgi:preprotein translocase subunit SecG